VVAPTPAAGIVSSLYWSGHTTGFSFLWINQASNAGCKQAWNGRRVGQHAPVASVVAARHPGPSTSRRVAWLPPTFLHFLINTLSALLHAACFAASSDRIQLQERRGDEAAAEPAAGASPDGQRRHGGHHAALPLRAHLHQGAILLRPIP
jgi:hypothetical protein